MFKQLINEIDEKVPREITAEVNEHRDLPISVTTVEGDAYTRLVFVVA